MYAQMSNDISTIQIVSQLNLDLIYNLFSTVVLKLGGRGPISRGSRDTI